MTLRDFWRLHSTCIEKFNASLAEEFGQDPPKSATGSCIAFKRRMGKRKAREEKSAEKAASSLKLKISDKDHRSIVVTFPSGYTPGSAKESVQVLEGAGPSGVEGGATTAVVVATDKRVDFVGTLGDDDTLAVYVKEMLSP